VKRTCSGDDPQATAKRLITADSGRIVSRVTPSGSERNVRFTPRLVLHPITTESAAELVDLHRDPGIAAWYEGPWSHRRAARFALDMERRWRRDHIGKWLAYERKSGQLVGRGGPSRTDALGGDAIEIGWTLRREHWGKGLATEIGRASLEYALQTVHASAIFAFTEAHNRRSRAVMERLGLVYSHEIRRRGYVEGREGVHDDAPFAVYRYDVDTRS
jgi:RimJ/RimL family protein N-acetyltransferase